MIRWIVLVSALLFAAGCGGEERTGGTGGAGGDVGAGGAGGDVGTGGSGGSGGSPGEGGAGGDVGEGGAGGDVGEGGAGGDGGSICVPATCEDLDASCGEVDDGCGNTIVCGTCEAPETCGGGGEPNVCGCTGETDAELCDEAGAVCGSITVIDSCGVERTVESCGSCEDPEVCGGGGEANVCGCTGETDAELCDEAGAVCGSITVTDSCGVERTVESCGSCQGLESCGGGGEANVCGCTPESDAVLCAAAEAACGSITVTDSCGFVRTVEDCGSCTEPEVCGGGGEANVCGCTAETDAELCTLNGAQCGSLEVTDSCGVVRTIADCGSCDGPAVCGGGGDPNVCGCLEEDDAALCQRLNASCGPMEVVDLCGVVRTVASCGTCVDGQVCGGDGIPNACGSASAWTQEHPSLADDLFAVWGAGPGSAWVAGAEGTLARFDGTRFVVHPSGTRATILDVWAPTSTSAWAVGEQGTLLRFDGVFWRQVHTGFWDDFRSVAGLGEDEIQVLADDGTQTYFVRWDGTSWSLQDPNLLLDERLARIRNVGGTLVATGTNGLVLTWDGQGWVRDLAGSTDLVAVAGVGDELWVAGDQDVRMHDGTSWSGNLAGYWLQSQTAIDLLGDGPSGKPWLLRTGAAVDQVLRHVSGTTWTALDLPFSGATALHGSGTGDAWVVGAAGHVARWNGQAFELASEEVPTCTQVTAGGTSAYALCGSQIWERAADGQWSVLPDRPTLGATVRAVWTDGTDGVWTFSTSSFGTYLFHWDGSAWSQANYNPSGSQVNTLAGDGDSIVMAGVGANVWKYDRTTGTRTAMKPSAISNALFAVEVVGDQIWVAGLNGDGAYYNGTSWSGRQRVANAHIRAMDALDAWNVWAVGDLGAASHWNGTAWVSHGIPFNTASDIALTDVWVEATDSVWAIAGGSGNLFHWNGIAWSLVDPSEHPSGIKALDVLADGTKIAVGAGMASGR